MGYTQSVSVPSTEDVNRGSLQNVLHISVDTVQKISAMMVIKVLTFQHHIFLKEVQNLRAV